MVVMRQALAAIASIVPDLGCCRLCGCAHLHLFLPWRPTIAVDCGEAVPACSCAMRHIQEHISVSSSRFSKHQESGMKGTPPLDIAVRLDAVVPVTDSLTERLDGTPSPRHEPAPGSNPREGTLRDSSRPRPAAHRSRLPLARRYGHRRPACGVGHRALHPLRDPGYRNTARAVRASSCCGSPGCSGLGIRRQRPRR